MDKKPYSPKEQDLVFEWGEKWLELVGLINKVTGTDEPPWSPPPPAALEELRYQSLRFWFIDYQTQFLPLWADFYECQGWALSQSCDSEDIADPEDIDKYDKNPFFYFYEPENLYHLAQQLDLQSGVDLWEPSEYRASMMRPILIRTGEIMVEFMDWASERISSPW